MATGHHHSSYLYKGKRTFLGIMQKQSNFRCKYECTLVSPRPPLQATESMPPPLDPRPPGPAAHSKSVSRFVINNKNQMTIKVAALATTTGCLCQKMPSEGYTQRHKDRTNYPNPFSYPFRLPRLTCPSCLMSICQPECLFVCFKAKI